MAMSKTIQKSQPKIIEGGLSIDDRGQVSFVNDFDFKGIKRFYIVSNHKAGFVRAWHAHKEEAKCILVLRGAAIVGAVAIDNFNNPSKKAKVHSYVLSEKNPRIFYIPAGYANGFMSLTDDTQLIFFSTATLKESQNDDFRYDSRFWDIWSIKDR